MRQGSKVAAWDACTGGVATEYTDVASGGRRNGRRGVVTTRATRGARRRGVDGGVAKGAGCTVHMDQWALAGLGMRAQRGRGANAARRLHGRVL
jgi:hypothetical protein